MTDTEFVPIADPETGEVIAEDEHTRALLFGAHLADVAEFTAAAADASRRAKHAERMALLLWRPGDRPFVHAGEAWSVGARRPPRVVDVEAIEREVERLPDALRPADVITTKRTFPGVRAIEAAAGKLAAAGLTPDDFLISGDPVPAIRRVKIDGEDQP